MQNIGFLHEDVKFILNSTSETMGWGHEIAKKMAEEDCGVIGFAGAITKSKAKSSWNQSCRYKRVNYRELNKAGKECQNNNLDPSVKFAQVVCLDGLALFVKRKVWEQNKFDQELLPNFHGYDIDFTLQVCQNYKNYVCNTVQILHFSSGNFNSEWVKASIAIHDVKWKDKLPISIQKINFLQVLRNEMRMNKKYRKRLRQIAQEKN